MEKPFDGQRIALERIAEEADRQTGFLDLSQLGLTKLPSETFKLQHLRRLHLGWQLRLEDEVWQTEMTDGPNNDLAAQLHLLANLPNLEALSICGMQCNGLAPIRSLNSLKWLDCSKTSVTTLDPIANLQSLKSVDFSMTRVSNLEPLTNLATLNFLNCSSNRLSDLRPIANLKVLKSLICHDAGISDLSSLATLPGLQLLNCGANPITDISPLAHLTELRSLDFKFTDVSDISAVEKLQELKSISLVGTKVKDLGPLTNVTALESLYFGYNNISDIRPLENLVELNYLSFGETPVSDISPLASLVSLEILYCYKTEISDLSPLTNLRALQFLECGDSPILELGPLANLKALQVLLCYGTAILDVAPLSSLPSLQVLNCSNCRLLAVPDALWFKSSLRELVLYKAYIPGIPEEVLSQDADDNCIDSLRAHLRDSATDPESMLDIKLLLLGNGKSGKTQIVNRLSGRAFQSSWDSTHGIRVSATDLPMRSGAATRLNIWDFGGQDIYHGTHALFVRTRAAFMLVWAKDTEATREYEHEGITFRNHPLLYWVEYVRHLAEKESPALIVQTKCDRDSDEEPRAPVPNETLKALGFVRELHVSSRNDRGGDELTAALRAAVSWLRENQGIATIGKGRLKVQRRIEGLRNPDGSLPPKYRLLDQETFRVWCEEAGNVSSPEHLLFYLHNAGVVFYQRGRFHDRIVLDHAWALNAIYAVFDRKRCYGRLQREGGQFDRARLEELVWKEGYSVEEQRLFLSMMEACGICFVYRHGPQWRDDDTIYIAPDLLPGRESVQAEVDERWGIEPASDWVTFDYPLLHPGLMRGVISRIGGHAGFTALYWRGGVYVYETTTRGRALIAQDMAPDAWTGMVRLQTKGGEARELLDRLSKLVTEENERMGLRPQVTRSSSSPLPASDAMEPPPLAFASEPATDFDYCVSYAWGDDTTAGREREAYVDKLCAEAVRRGRRILRDKTAMGLGDRISEFMRRLGRGRRVFVILSDKYLRSPYCTFELYEVWKNSRMDDDEFMRRVRVYKLPEVRIGTLAERKGYYDFWQQQLTEQSALIGDLNAKGHLSRLPLLDFQRHQTMSRFAEHVLEILALVADGLQPRTWDDFVRHGFEDPRERKSPRD